MKCFVKNIMNKKYQIFISSTYDDLKEERKKVQDAILSMYHFPIGMELFSASDKEQWNIIEKTISSSDYYVLIIGHRYGTTIENGKYAGISYTEKEFLFAVSKKIPVLAFLIDKNVAVTPDKMERDPVKIKKLEDFKEKVKNGRMVEWWSNEYDLANKVMNSLNKQFTENARSGWIRYDQASITNIEPVEKIMVGTYKLIYYSTMKSKKIEPIISELCISENGKVEFLNNFDNVNKKRPEYTYLGYCNFSSSNIYIYLKNNISDENVVINLINSVGDHNRYIGLMFALSSNNIPVCVKVACIKKQIWSKINTNTLKDILMSKNKMFNSNAFILEESAKLRFFLMIFLYESNV